MKLSFYAVSSVLAWGLLASHAVAAMSTKEDIIQENIVFSLGASSPSDLPPPSVTVTMGHKPNSKMRSFYLPKDSYYGEMKNLVRHHLTGDHRVGGYFVDELVSKDETYVVVLAGQVRSSEDKDKKTYSKQGTWMDSLGRSGTWVDQEQKDHPTTLMAACGGAK